jgi:hypothetical protein
MSARPVIPATLTEAVEIDMKFLIFILLLPMSLLAQGAQSVHHVKYVTVENVYLDAGSADSLAVGDTLTISHADSVIAELEIAFVAEHSSSCKILSETQEIKIGDIVRLKRKSDQSQAPALTMPTIDTTKTTLPQKMGNVQPAVKTPTARIYGGVALQLYRFSDRSPANLDFTQPSLRINLRATTSNFKRFPL